ncbi:histone-lysine N-methyltransferase SETMAR [Trichonephila clavipes]|nr:histone-lysine N-methyltransferase SETMAR [Trichonephila clavipes]
MHVWVSGPPKMPIAVGENASQMAEIVNGDYGADTVSVNYVKFWFRRFLSDIFNVKDAPSTGRPVVENVDKVTEIIQIDRYVSSHSSIQELKIDLKANCKHFAQSWIQKEVRCL